MKWVIENFVGENGYEELAQEVRNQGLECIMLDIRNHFELRINPQNECVIFQGSIQLGRKLKEELNSCHPVTWLTPKNYYCSHYYPKLNRFLFNDDHIFTTAESLKKEKWAFYERFGKEAMLFVRPDEGEKSFSGGLLDLQDFDRIWDLNLDRGLLPSDTVLVSNPKNIGGEWRFICTDSGEIIAQSCYKFQGKRTYVPSAPEKATALVKEILSVGYFPDRVFTVDIVMDNDGNFWLMELNSFSCAGMYACNKKSIVEKVSKIAQEDYENHL